MEGWIIAGAVASMVAALGVIFVVLTLARDQADGHPRNQQQGCHLVVRSDVDAELRRQASEEWDAYERARQTSPYPPVIPGTHRSTIRLLVSWTYPSGLAEKQHLEWVEEY